MLGDLSYMSPEQLGSGHLCDQRSDIYQLAPRSVRCLPDAAA